jgi:hypothetical protein
MTLDELEAVAKAAQERSPGPWRRFEWHDEVKATDGRVSFIRDSSPAPDWYDIGDGEYLGNTVLETDGGYYEPKGVTAQHIATFSPDVVLKLLCVARAAIQAAADIRSETPDGGASQYALLMAVDALEDP